MRLMRPVPIVFASWLLVLTSTLDGCVVESIVVCIIRPAG